jgi:hypothetical protein
MRTFATVTIVALILVAANTPAIGCSVALCLNHGIEMSASFRVHITTDDKTLPGVSVSVTSMVEGDDSETRRPALELQTDSLGEVQINKLQPGNYWITATLLGLARARLVSM